MNNVRMEMVLTHSDDVVSREIDGALIIVPLTSGMGDMEDDLFSLNETGTEIWRMLDGTSTVGEVIAALADRYEAAPGEIQRDVIGMIRELLKRSMLVETAAQRIPSPYTAE
jgi:hypothetical protein